MKEAKKEKDDNRKSDKKSLKQSGPNLEVSTVQQDEKKLPSKKTVMAKIDGTTPASKGPENSAGSSSPALLDSNSAELKDSFIVCSHIAEQLDLDSIKSIAKKFGVDLDAPVVDPLVAKREMNKKIAAWKKCPNRLDFRKICRNPETGEICPIVQSYMTPQVPDQTMMELCSRLSPGTIGIGRRQVAFHTGGPLPNTNDPHFLELGRRADGTMCVTIQYAPEAQPPPEYICTTVRETQAVDTTYSGKKSKSSKKSVGGKKKKSIKGKKGKK